jgi:ferrous iron transport protein A
LQLSELKVGDTASVKSFGEGAKAYRAKLLAMGMTPGTAFTVIRTAPLGDPIEIRVRGFALSLRKKEADSLQIEKVET